MRRADAVCAGVLALLAGVVIAEGWRLGIGWGTDGPQPGFFVFYLGVALLAACAVILVQAASRDAPLYRRPFLARGQLAPVLKVAGPAVLMVLLTHFLGLYVSGVLYLAGYMRWIGRHSWLQVAVVSVAIPLVSFLIFEVWFLVPMPKGPLEALLGF